MQHLRIVSLILGLVLTISLMRVTLVHAQRPILPEIATTSSDVMPETIVEATPEPLSTPAPVLDRLELFIRNTQRPELTPFTFLQYAIWTAVSKGVSPTLVVFLLMFPVVASMVAFSRHVIGLSGFSIFAPSALAVVLLSTGIVSGIFLFVATLVVAVVGKQAIKHLRLEYIPRHAMLLWFVALGLFFTVFASTNLPIQFIFRIDVFPLLLLVLLTDDFMGLQSDLPWRLAVERSLQMMFLAVIGALLMANTGVQTFVLEYPEAIVIGVAVFNFIVGKYLGLRLSEYLRFKPIIEAEE